MNVQKLVKEPIMELTVAALTAESFLKACRPIHARLTAWNHDLVGVGFGASEVRSGEWKEE